VCFLEQYCIASGCVTFWITGAALERNTVHTQLPPPLPTTITTKHTHAFIILIIINV
jgi:hypothetical protein